jgi:catechol 2,3-dioxygenase-like lactoylglutathione lyase family enzyme
MKNAVGAITLFVDDKERAKEFYGRAFAAEPLFEDETSAVFRFENLVINAVVRSNAPELVEPAPVAAPGAGAGALYTIWVDDCDAAVATLRERGVELLNGPTDRPWGVRTAAFADPDGHAWEVAQQLGV